MQLLDRLAVVSKLRSEPVEQLGVGGLCAHAAEIVWCRDDPGAEVVLPNAVDDRSPRERMIFFCQPTGEGDSTVTFPVRVGEFKRAGIALCQTQRAGSNFITRLAHVATVEYANGARLAAFIAGAAKGTTSLVDCSGVNAHWLGHFFECCLVLGQACLRGIPFGGNFTGEDGLDQLIPYAHKNFQFLCNGGIARLAGVEGIDQIAFSPANR